jgi:hypothetical protein
LRGARRTRIVCRVNRPRRPWHRDGIPAWGWAALVVMRLAALAWTLIPLLLLAAGLWWWAHGGGRDSQPRIRHAVEHARAAADSLFGR